jgi:archaeal flagellar protein FlaH
MAAIDAPDALRRRVVSTGSTEIDKKMGGGIPEGSLILIEGSSNAGKSVVTQQLVHGALNSNFRTVLYTTENTIRSLLRQMESLALEVQDFYLLGALNIYPLPAAMTPEGAETAFHKLIDHVRTLEGRFDCVFIDSLTSFVSQVPEAATLQFLTSLKELVDENMTGRHVHADAVAVRCALETAHGRDARPDHQSARGGESSRR